MQQIEWTPHAVQKEFAELPDSIFEGFYGGAAFGGKTDILLMLTILRQFYHHPRFKAIFFRRTFPELESEVIPRSHRYFPATGARFNEQKHTWTFPEGGIFKFQHMEHKESATKRDSDEYNLALFDELTHFFENQYIYFVTTRVRTSDSQLPFIVRSGSNPGRVGHGWVRKRFVEPCREGRRILISKVVDPVTGQLVDNKRIFIPARLTDNKPGMAADPGYAARLMMLDEAERRAKLYGDWWSYEGQVFQFREFRFPSEPENAVHVCEPFTIPFWWPRVLAIDWGVAAYTAAYWLAISPSGRIYTYREYCEKEKLISEWAPTLRRMSTQPDGELENIKAVVLCQSAWQRRGTPQTIAQQFQAESGFIPEMADNDRVGGLSLLKEYFRWWTKPKVFDQREGYDADLASKIFRLYGADKLREYISYFDGSTEDESCLPRTQIFNTCTKLIETIQLCVYDENNKEDIAEFPGDDPYDAWRYGNKAAARFIAQVAGKESPIAQIQQAVERLQQSQDMTSYYRHMEALEAKQAASQAVYGRRRRIVGRYSNLAH